MNVKMHLCPKSLCCSALVLSAPDLVHPFKLEVYTSMTGVGAVLLQDGADGISHPVSYYSAKFNCYQLNYSTIEKETLAMLLALQQFLCHMSDTSLLPTSLHGPQSIDFLK